MELPSFKSMTAASVQSSRGFAAHASGKKLKVASQLHVGSHAVNKCIVSDRAGPGMDVLNVRGDIHPGCYLEVVEGFDAGSVARTEHGLRKRAELVAGTDIVPADAELIAALLSDRAVTADAGTEEVPAPGSDFRR